MSSKAEKILDIALELLKTSGDHGVTMRQVATKADMSLSNVQYYFKTKEILLKAVADRYFAACIKEMKDFDDVKTKQGLSKLIKTLLSHGLELSEMCRIFREYWAISARNDEINEYIMDYYREMAAVLSEKLTPIGKDKKSIARAVTVIIPYTEGYSIAALAMPDSYQNTVKTLTNIIYDLSLGEDR